MARIRRFRLPDRHCSHPRFFALFQPPAGHRGLADGGGVAGGWGAGELKVVVLVGLDNNP